jgi:hypothetical protein
MTNQETAAPRTTTQEQFDQLVAIFVESLRQLKAGAGGALELDEESIAAAIASAEQASQQLAETGDIDPVIAAGMSEAFAEVLREVPSAAGFTEDDLRELFAEVVQELQQEMEAS